MKKAWRRWSLTLAACAALLCASARAAEDGDAPPPPSDGAEGTALACDMRDILFDYDDTNIRAHQKGKVVTIASCWKRLTEAHGGGVHIKLVGHTDFAGCLGCAQEDYALQVTWRYAETVKRALVKEGVDAREISADGRGRFAPAFSMGLRRDPRNWRVEVTLIGPSGEVLAESAREPGPVCQMDPVMFDFSNKTLRRDMLAVVEWNKRCFEELARRADAPLKLGHGRAPLRRSRTGRWSRRCLGSRSGSRRTRHQGRRMWARCLGSGLPTHSATWSGRKRPRNNRSPARTAAPPPRRRPARPRCQPCRRLCPSGRRLCHGMGLNGICMRVEYALAWLASLRGEAGGPTGPPPPRRGHA
jgi:outer membrane protein OmpA-like peptidoglycan-associated protein